jgi:prophage tail gpP-like protein
MAGGSAPFKSLLIVPAEQPVKSKAEADDRAMNEAIWHEAPIIDVTIFVQGWLRDGYNLWLPGDKVYVYSPMCPLDMVMKIYKVTFTQDSNGGTQTQLDLQPPWGWKDKGSMNVGPLQRGGNNPAPINPETGQPIPPNIMTNNAPVPG